MPRKKKETRPVVHSSKSLVLEWHAFVLWQSFIHRGDGRTLLLQYAERQHDSYGVLAVEGASETIGTVGLLDDHAHAVVIEDAKTERAAQDAALAFARKWLDGQALEVCGCETIGGATNCATLKGTN